MRARAALPALVALAGMAGCALAPSAPAVVVPEALRPPADESLLRTLDAHGVQVYECRAKDGAAAWSLLGPEATLVDEHGAPAGRHYAGLTWEARDGSKVVGEVEASVEPPDGAIAWLLLATHPAGPKGAFSRVTSIQRVATSGGAAPSAGCGPATLGRQARVPYRAQYVLYARIF